MSKRKQKRLERFSGLAMSSFDYPELQVSRLREIKKRIREVKAKVAERDFEAAHSVEYRLLVDTLITIADPGTDTFGTADLAAEALKVVDLVERWQ